MTAESPSESPPRVLISYSHDSDEHRARVLALSNRFRSEGINCFIDQYEQAPPKGWPTWCDDQIEFADFVLIVCTQTYLRRFKKQEEPRRGLGVTFEGHIITQEIYDGRGAIQSSFRSCSARKIGHTCQLLLKAARASGSLSSMRTSTAC